MLEVKGTVSNEDTNKEEDLSFFDCMYENSIKKRFQVSYSLLNVNKLKKAKKTKKAYKAYKGKTFKDEISFSQLENMGLTCQADIKEVNQMIIKKKLHPKGDFRYFKKKERFFIYDRDLFSDEFLLLNRKRIITFTKSLEFVKLTALKYKTKNIEELKRRFLPVVHVK